MCDRFARSQNSSLPQKFWDNSYWLQKFKLQLMHANSLLKDYHIDNILSALRHPDAKKIYSLGLKKVLIPLIEQSQAQSITQQKITKLEKIQIENVDTDQKPRRPFGRKTNLQKLRELENG
jgi:hypothetical protein